jgi:putative MATE family efflux protein
MIAEKRGYRIAGEQTLLGQNCSKSCIKFKEVVYTSNTLSIPPLVCIKTFLIHSVRKHMNEQKGFIRDLTQGSISKNLWALALPMVLGLLAETALGLIDMFYVGKLSPQAIAAVSMARLISWMLMIFVEGLCIATTAMVARFYGAGEREMANRVGNQSILLGMSSSLLLGIIGYYFSEDILRLVGAGPDVIAVGLGYMQILFLGTITMFLLLLCDALLRGAGNTVLPMKIFAFTCVLTAMIDPLLIFGLGPFPRLEVTGAACASVFSRGVGAILVIYLLSHKNSKVRISLKNLKVEPDIMWRLIKIGVPGTLRLGLWSTADLVLMKVIALFGTFAVASYGIGLRLESLVFMIGISIAASSATLVGQNLGAAQPERAEKSAWTAVGHSSLILSIISILYFFAASPLLALFTNDTEVLRIGIIYLQITAVCYIFRGVGQIMGSSLNGAGDTIPPLIVTAISMYCTKLPLAYILSTRTEWGLTGIWVAIVISYILYAFAMTLWFNKGKWKKKAI